MKRFDLHYFYSAIGALAALVGLGVYIWVYMEAPFADLTNRFIENAILTGVAFLCALILTLISRYFQPGEPPRQIWAMFAAAMWMWTLGEVVWAFYNLTDPAGEVPSFSVADIFWFFGYIFLTISLTRQFSLIYVEYGQRIVGMTVAMWVFGLLSTVAVMQVWGLQDAEDFLAVFYPIGDFFIGLAALALIIIFRRGWLGRPWLSLLVFVVADSLYIWATSTDQYNFAMSQDTVSLVVDSVYLAAYMVLGWGVTQQFLLLWLGSKPMDTASAMQER